FASRQIACVSSLITREAYALKKSVYLLCEKSLPTLKRSVRNILAHGFGKKIRGLHDHTQAAPQFFWCYLSLVLAIELYGATRRLVEPVEQPQERRFPGSARTNHGYDLANLDLDTNILYENLVPDRAGEIFGFERDGLRGLLLLNPLEIFESDQLGQRREVHRSCDAASSITAATSFGLEM